MFEAQATESSDVWLVRAFLVDPDLRELRPILDDLQRPIEMTSRWSLAYLSVLSRIETALDSHGTMVVAPRTKGWPVQRPRLTLHQLRAQRADRWRI